MVFFVMTRNGYQELLTIHGKTPSPIWLNSGVLSVDEIANIRKDGDSVTVFTERRDQQSQEDIAEALATIQMHHEGETVWVEFAPEF